MLKKTFFILLTFSKLYCPEYNHLEDPQVRGLRYIKNQLETIKAEEEENLKNSIFKINLEYQAALSTINTTSYKVSYLKNEIKDEVNNIIKS